MDKTLISIKNPKLFVSAKTGAMIKEEATFAVNDIPRQAPDWVNIKALERQAKATSVSVRALIIILIVL